MVTHDVFDSLVELEGLSGIGSFTSVATLFANLSPPPHPQPWFSLPALGASAGGAGQRPRGVTTGARGTAAGNLEGLIPTFFFGGGSPQDPEDAYPESR